LCWRSSDEDSMATGGLEQSFNDPGSAVPVPVDETYENIRAPKFYDFSRLVDSKLRQLLPREPDSTSSKSVSPAARSPSEPSGPRGERNKEKGDGDSVSSPISGTPSSTCTRMMKVSRRQIFAQSRRHASLHVALVA